MNNSVFKKKLWKIFENIATKNLSQQKKRRNYLVSGPNYHIIKFFTETLLAIEMKKTQILLNKSIYLGLSILELSKTVMQEFWYVYVKTNNGEKAKLCYMDTNSFIVYIKTDIYKDIAEDVETKFETSNYELNRPLPKGKNKKVIVVMKDKLGEKNKRISWIKSKSL